MNIPIACMTKGIRNDVMLAAIGLNESDQHRISTDRNSNIANVYSLLRMASNDRFISMMTRMPEFQSLGVVGGGLDRGCAPFSANFLHYIQNDFHGTDM